MSFPGSVTHWIAPRKAGQYTVGPLGRFPHTVERKMRIIRSLWVQESEL
jgi:hypothetical protein